MGIVQIQSPHRSTDTFVIFLKEVVVCEVNVGSHLSDNWVFEQNGFHQGFLDWQKSCTDFFAKSLLATLFFLHFAHYFLKNFFWPAFVRGWVTNYWVCSIGSETSV